MLRNSLKLIFCLTLLSQTLSAAATEVDTVGIKPIVVLAPDTARMVLKDLAELDMRRDDAKTDSTTIVDLYSANFEQEQEVGSLHKALKECEGGSADKEKLIITQGKEIRKQKRLKILAIVGIAVLAVVEIIVPK